MRPKDDQIMSSFHQRTAMPERDSAPAAQLRQPGADTLAAGAPADSPRLSRQGARVAQLAEWAAASAGTGALQLRCRKCEQEDRGAPASLASAPVQRVECQTSNRGGEQLHDYVVNHMAAAKGWGKEYQVRQGGPLAPYGYADLVTPAATRVYEVKSTGVGAAQAALEAAQYAAWITTRCPQNAQVGTWTGYEQFDMGELGQACIRGHGGGAITYLRDLTGAACNTLL